MKRSTVNPLKNRRAVKLNRQVLRRAFSWRHRSLPMAEPMESRVLFSAEAFDQAFGVHGTVSLAESVNIPSTAAAAVQPNGRIVVMTVSMSPDGTSEQLQVRRLMPDGSMDSSFGTRGTTVLPADSFAREGTLLIQPDGNIVVVYASTLARLMRGGTLDTSFANGKGFETLPSSAASAALQSDGKIDVFAGVLSNAGIYRFNSNGSTDSSYGTGGIASLGTPDFATGGIAIDSLGRAVVSFASQTPGGTNDFEIERFSTNGAIDGSFGVSGASTDGGFDAAADWSSVAIAPNGTIYLAGNYDEDTGNDTKTISQFSTNGAFIARNVQTIGGGIFSLVVQPDNKLMAAGYEFNPQAPFNVNALVERFSPDSVALDSSFNGTGSLEIDYATGDDNRASTNFGDRASSITLQPDGKIIVADNTYSDFGSTNTSKFAVSRLTNDVSTSGSTIRGTLFDDANQNRVMDSGESALAGWSMYLDLSNSGVYSVADPITKTDAAGHYSFSGLVPGTWIVRAIPLANWQQTTPTNPYGLHVTVGLDQSVIASNIGFHPVTTTASISGTFFYDSNANGKWDTGESISPLWGVYIDVNHDGKQDTGDIYVRADSNGKYTFTGLVAGSYTIRPATAVGWAVTSPASGAQIVTVSAGQNLTNINFGEYHGVVPPASISGTFFYDFNGNGKWDTGESISPSWGVYIDVNKDGKQDAGDIYIRANASGKYIFDGLAAGTYVIRAATATGWQQTFPASGGAQVITLGKGQSVAGVNFGERRIG